MYEVYAELFVTQLLCITQVLEIHSGRRSLLERSQNMAAKRRSNPAVTSQVREGSPDKSRSAKKTAKPTYNPVREGSPDKSRSAKKVKGAASNPVREGSPDKSRGAKKR